MKWGQTQMLADAFGGPTLGDDDALIRSATHGEPEYEAVELILKGPEVSLPENLWYLDKDGHLRQNARYRWWSDGDMTLRERAVFVPGANCPTVRCIWVSTTRPSNHRCPATTPASR